MHAAELLHDNANGRQRFMCIAPSCMHNERSHRAGCTTIERNADATIRTHASSTKHDDAAIRVHYDQVHGCKMHADRTIARMQRVQCMRRQRVHDLGRVTYGPIPYGQGPPSQDSGSEVITIAHHAHLRVNTLGCTICNITPRRPLRSQSHSSSRSVQFLTSRVREWMHSRLGDAWCAPKVRPLSNRTGVMTRVLEGNLQREPEHLVADCSDLQVTTAIRTFSRALPSPRD